MAAVLDIDAGFLAALGAGRGPRLQPTFATGEMSAGDRAEAERLEGQMARGDFGETVGLLKAHIAQLSAPFQALQYREESFEGEPVALVGEVADRFIARIGQGLLPGLYDEAARSFFESLDVGYLADSPELLAGADADARAAMPFDLARGLSWADPARPERLIEFLALNGIQDALLNIVRRAVEADGYGQVLENLAGDEAYHLERYAKEYGTTVAATLEAMPDWQYTLHTLVPSAPEKYYLPGDLTDDARRDLSRAFLERVLAEAAPAGEQ